MAARNFQDLIVWQKAHGFVLQVYSWTEDFPRREVYGLTSQLRRAAFAQGSLEETRYYLILASDLGYGCSRTLTMKLEEVSKLLESYMGKIQESIFDFILTTEF